MYEIDQNQCKKFGECVDACPIAVIAKKTDESFEIGEDCTECGACEPVCNAKAIRRVS